MSAPLQAHYGIYRNPLFSLDTLVNMLAAAGIRVRMEIDAPEVERAEVYA
jgi:hypothetical protein